MISTAQTNGKELASLYPLIGTWQLQTKKGMLYEKWIKVNDSTLSNISYRINGSDSVVLEKVQLISRGQSIMYIPIIEDQNNQQPVIFVLASLENGKYTFENKEHDYPQRVIYNLPVNNTMHAWIEGTSNGKFVKSDFRFTKKE